MNGSDCDGCGKIGIFQSYGTLYEKKDKFYPKYLCNNCAKEWKKFLIKQKFFKVPRDNEGDIKTYQDIWAKEFKKWLVHKSKEKVNFD